MRYDAPSLMVNTYTAQEVFLHASAAKSDEVRLSICVTQAPKYAIIPPILVSLMKMPIRQ
jgi:ribosomal protein L31